MARIRTIKPDFFRHELLQSLEAAHPGKHPMLVFAGLFGHCDKNGVFLWSPNHLKLDILPFLPFEITETLTILESNKLVTKFKHAGKTYGFIPSFSDHQMIQGKEAQAPARFPEPPKGKRRGSDREVSVNGQGMVREVPVKRRGSVGEVSGNAGREGKGRELGKEVEGNRQTAPAMSKPVDKSHSKQNGKSANDWALELGIARVVGEHEGAFQARVLAAVQKHTAEQQA